MLNDELSIWHQYLDQLKSDHFYVTGQSMEVYSEKLLLEKKQITDAWLTVAFSETPDLALGRYFRFHQQEVRWLILQVEEMKVGSEKQAMSELLLQGLRELLNFLKRHFVRYLVPDESLDALMDKVLLNLSVAQLGCLLKLAYDAGLFPNITVAELIRSVVLYCRTKKQVHISAKSLSKEYYSVSQVTAATCREMLTQLIKRIDKIYFT